MAKVFVLAAGLAMFAMAARLDVKTVVTSISSSNAAADDAGPEQGSLDRIVEEHGLEVDPVESVEHGKGKTDSELLVMPELLDELDTLPVVIVDEINGTSVVPELLATTKQTMKIQLNEGESVLLNFEEALLEETESHSHQMFSYSSVAEGSEDSEAIAFAHQKHNEFSSQTKEAWETIMGQITAKIEEHEGSKFLLCAHVGTTSKVYADIPDEARQKWEAKSRTGEEYDEYLNRFMEFRAEFLESQISAHQNETVNIVSIYHKDTKRFAALQLHACKPEACDEQVCRCYGNSDAKNMQKGKESLLDGELCNGQANFVVPSNA